MKSELRILGCLLSVLCLCSAIVVLGLMTGCVAGSPGSAGSAHSDVAVVATEIAVETMRPDQVERVPRSQCTVCNGTGRVKAGDSVTVVWHECENCYDDSPSAAAPCPCGDDCPCGSDCRCGDDCQCDILAGGYARRVVIFTAGWCVPCQEMKGDLLPWAETQTPEAPLTKLLSTGWEVGKSSEHHFQLVDIDDHPEMCERFGFDSIPMCVALVDGEIVGSESGYLDQWQLADLYNTEAPERTPPVEVSADEPGAFMNLGSLSGMQAQIAELRELLTLFGGRGSIEVRPDCDGVCLVDWPISSTTSLRLTTPVTVHYALNDSGTISLRFDQPIPVRYRFLRGGITSVEISTDQVEVKINGLPDGFFRIES